MKYDDRQWVAKFSRADDRSPMCRIEYVTMKLAEKVGITVPSIRLEKVLDQDVYLIERFDRVPNDRGYRRLPFISGLTILGAHESESSRQSYRGLADQLRRFGSDPVRDAKQLWQRMVFNILCNNNDDHLRNHGFLWMDEAGCCPLATISLRFLRWERSGISLSVSVAMDVGQRLRMR